MKAGDFNRLMKTTHIVEDQVTQYLFYVDTHLSELHKAMEKKDNKNIDFHKEKLQDLHKRLMACEYFKFSS
jgi:hypothetical protein